MIYVVQWTIERRGVTQYRDMKFSTKELAIRFKDSLEEGGLIKAYLVEEKGE